MIIIIIIIVKPIPRKAVSKSIMIMDYNNQ